MKHIHIVTSHPNNHSLVVNSLRSAGFRVTLGPKAQECDYELRPDVTGELSFSEGQLQLIQDTLDRAKSCLDECKAD